MQTNSVHVCLNTRMAGLEVGYITVSAYWPSALNCNPWNFVPLDSVRMLWRLCPALPIRA